ncbi:hypothetical protein SCHPADRAFT_794484, partial [Schizopora paradoxa]
GSSGINRRIAGIQRQATKLITGGLRSTAQDTLDYHAFLPPTHLRLAQSLHKQTVRLCSLPPQHPLHAITHRSQRIPRFHRSPVHYLFLAFPELKGKVEVITPRPVGTPAIGALTFTVPSNRDAARKSVLEIVRAGGHCIFSDGSGFDGGVGSAAVAY